VSDASRDNRFLESMEPQAGACYEEYDRIELLDRRVPVGSK
jgi:hypothetical protein